MKMMSKILQAVMLPMRLRIVVKKQKERGNPADQMIRIQTSDLMRSVHPKTLRILVQAQSNRSRKK